MISSIKRLVRELIGVKNLNLIRYRGNKVECVCCGGKFSSFLPFGVIKRPNAKCPRCGSLERHRLHWKYFLHRTNLMDSDGRRKLLHVAPEPVFFKIFKDKLGFEYVPCAKFGEGYRDKYPEGTLNIDITDINIADNSFDVIYCSHVLEHIPDDAKAMRELFRVLKPGGWALLQVPLDKRRETTYEDFSITEPAAREKAFGQYDHVRVYGLDYKQRLEKAGFSVIVEDYVSTFPDVEIRKYGFTRGDDIYYCKKE